MNLAVIVAIAYGVLSIIGGIVGYKQAQSKMSLISGSVSGTLLILGGVVATLGQAWGLILAAVITAVLIVVFLIRLFKTRKFMPAGLMTILGVVVLAVMIQQGAVLG
ncbi:MAG: hypothetical protein KME06_00480 [Kastovskya adunca ATA6-11-RM4]|jgi:uncharacterized membrane protein (UPF0136 family)|nr:hypothetical protein [Kastovskya adunca ATA6-11-RM4]